MRSEPRSRAFSNTRYQNVRLKKVSSTPSTIVGKNIMQLVGIFCSAGACTMHFFELRKLHNTLSTVFEIFRRNFVNQFLNVEHFTLIVLFFELSKHNSGFGSCV